MHKEEIRSLTGLRFLIALYVFVFHIHIRWPIFDNFVLVEIANQGAIGMTFFFVLSGFILSYTYNSDLKVSSYFRSRLARIYPIYILAAILTLPWLVLPGYIGKNPSFFEVTFLLAVGLLLLQAWFPPTFSRWNNGGSWSISVEVFFYFCFPALKKIIDKQDRRDSFYFLFSGYSMILVISLSVYVYQSEGMSIAYSMPIFRLFEFVIGMLTYKLFYMSNLILFNGYSLIFISGIFLADLVFIGDKLPLYVTHDWIAVPFFVVLLINLSKSRSLLSRILGGRIFNLLGRSSYSFYSLQVFFILLSIKWKSKLELKWQILENNQVFALTFFFVLILSSIFAYKIIEEPFRKRINQKR
jgi:peptidoglycan/LPS O-acetylase OafA/YrhL